MSNDNCSSHEKAVLGESDMKKLAAIVGNLHYETLTEFLYHLSQKINYDGEKDYESGREKLASALQYLSMSIFESSLRSNIVWQICKPYMKEDVPK
jgi:hypothetical protein